jgi:hypothetical protein
MLEGCKAMTDEERQKYRVLDPMLESEDGTIVYVG